MSVQSCKRMLVARTADTTGWFTYMEIRKKCNTERKTEEGRGTEVGGGGGGRESRDMVVGIE